MKPTLPGGEPDRFFTPGTGVALGVVVLCLVAVAWQPQTGPEAVPEPESSALLELQSKLIVGLAGLQRDRALEEVRELESLAVTPAGARALAALYLYLRDDALKGEARRLLEAAPEETETHRILLGATLASGSIPEPDREVLLERMGWFGLLAVAADDPEARGRVTSSGQRLLLVGFLGMLAVAGAFCLGLVLLGAAALQPARVRSRLAPATVPSGIHVQAFAVYLVAMIGGGLLAARLGASGLTGSSVVILAALLAGAGYPLLRGVSWADLRREWGLHRGRGVFRECLAGLAAYCAALPVITLGVVITVMLQKLAGGWADGEGGGSPQAISHPILGVLKGAGWRGLVLVGFLASVQGPIVEEIMFRGAFYRGLRGRFGPMVSLVGMAFCFAAVHPQGLLAVPGLMGMAIAFGAMREWRDSLVAGMVTHGLHNGVLLAFMAAALSG